MKKKTQKSISSISVISSASCNLKCKFCYLHKNKSYHEFDKLVHEAWQNGDYLKNIVSTLKNLNVKFEDMNIIQLWGGESLLRVEDITLNVKDLYRFFPNLNEWRVSTNLLINIDNFFALLKEIELHSHGPTQFRLQISIDGPPGPFSEAGHHGDWSVYRSNMKKFLSLLNSYKFRKLNINIAINATVAKDLYLTKFLDYNEMKNYVKYMSDFMKEIDEQSINGIIHLGGIEVFPTYASPSEDTAEDGLKLLAICRLWDQVKLHEFPEFSNNFHFYKGTGDVSMNYGYFDPNPECSELLNSLTINYDGSLMQCSSAFINNFDPYLKELIEENNMHEYYSAKMHNAVTYNPRLISEDEQDFYNWTIHDGYKNTNLIYLHCMVVQALELAKSGQIDPVYLYDRDLLLKHLKALSNVNSCMRDNDNSTHIPFLLSISSLRRYLNGFINYSVNQEQFIHDQGKIQYLEGEKNNAR